MFLSVHWDRPKQKQSDQDVRPGKQTLTTTFKNRIITNTDEAPYVIFLLPHAPE